MFLYLVQHGLAKPKEEDPERGLTDEGRRAVERVGAMAARWGAKPRLILHSGKTRARQTAEVLAEHLAPSDGVHPREGMAPTDDVVAFWKEVDDVDSIMLVGHLPFLSRLAGLLVTGDPGAEPIHFSNGAIVRLTTSGRVGWKVDAVVPPDVVPQG